jgi:hypothetical protein
MMQRKDSDQHAQACAVTCACLCWQKRCQAQCVNRSIDAALHAIMQSLTHKLPEKSVLLIVHDMTTLTVLQAKHTHCISTSLGAITATEEDKILASLPD